MMVGICKKPQDGQRQRSVEAVSVTFCTRPTFGEITASSGSATVVITFVPQRRQAVREKNTSFVKDAMKPASRALQLKIGQLTYPSPGSQAHLPPRSPPRHA